MHEASHFLAGILADPLDDGPRLVFSDWLEEHGDGQRAEFIRAQCEAARLPMWERRRQELMWRADALLMRHGNRWRAELPVLDGIEWREFERGFVSTVRIVDAKTLRQHAEAIARAAPVYRVEVSRPQDVTGSPPKEGLPWLRALRFTEVGRHYDPPVQSRTGHVHPSRSLLGVVKELELVGLQEYAHLGWLTSNGPKPWLMSLKLEGSHTLGREFARWVAGPARTEHLTRLDLGTRFVDYNSGYFEDPTLGTPGAELLARAAHLENLEALNLNRQRIGDQGLAAILTSPHLANLRELEVRAAEATNVNVFRRSGGSALLRLDLSENAIGDYGAADLAGASRLTEVKRLDLDTCEIGVKGLTALVSAPFWAAQPSEPMWGTLRHLDLSRNPLGAAGAWVLAGANAPENLHTLRLADCDFDAEAGAALGTADWFRNLLILDLSRNPFGAAGARMVGRLAGGTLRSLSLSAAGVDREGAALLAPLVTRLVHLDLSNNPLRDNGPGLLFADGPAADLQGLSLANCSLTHRGLKALLRHDPCPQLHTLSLAGNALERGGIELLVESSLLGQLRHLDLSRCGLTAEAAVVLAGAPAVAGLERLDLRQNDLGEAGLLALARSPHLRRVSTIQLAGNPWGYSEAARRELEERFGRYWYYQQEEEEQEEYEDED